MTERGNGRDGGRRTLRRGERPGGRTPYHLIARSWSSCRVRPAHGKTTRPGLPAVDVERIGLGCVALAVDGVQLGTVQGLYEGGPLHGHLLIHGPADRPRSIAIYLVPLWALRHHCGDGPAHLSVPVSYVRCRWLIDVIDDVPSDQLPTTDYRLPTTNKDSA